MFSIRPAVNAICSSSSATQSPASSDVVSTNVTLPPVLVSDDSASDEDPLCKIYQDTLTSLSESIHQYIIVQSMHIVCAYYVMKLLHKG